MLFWIFAPASPSFTPLCSCSLARSVLRSSTHLVSLLAPKALDGFLLASSDFVPFDPSAPSYRCRLRLPTYPFGLHMIRLVPIKPFLQIGCLRFVFTINRIGCLRFVFSRNILQFHFTREDMLMQAVVMHFDVLCLRVEDRVLSKLVCC